jgi:hypothetical protein
LELNSFTFMWRHNTWKWNEYTYAKGIVVIPS